MSETREERRLAAIVIGDVVGYSRLMGADEIGTMTALKAHRRDVILPLLTRFRARLVNTTGDAMLLEFGSAVDAVSCAATLQRAMQARNADVDPDRRIRFRLGINLGDIVIDGDEIYGDGVNVAARLETLCEPGGLCLSRAVEEQVKDKLPYAFDDRGEQALKNITRPVRVYGMSEATIATLPEPVMETEARLAAPGQLQVTPGTTLNDAYAVDRLIGSGGMGEIFEGREIHTGDAVAIKLIRLDMEGNEAALGLFQKEASVLKHLYHEAVVRYYVFSFDQTVRRHYLAMEYVNGPSLSDVMRDGPLAFEAVDALRKRVAAGLEVAHERGIVHRDVSPDNIILPQGDVTRAKIIDFGIARSNTLGGGTIIGGGFAGKYNYVSPEQLGLFGGDVTARSDIYSFGLVLAGALMGEPIDMGGTQADTIEKRRIVPAIESVDERLRALLAAMLEPDPERRLGTMSEVAAWRPLAAPVAPLPVRSTPKAALTTGPQRKRPLPHWIIGGTLAMALLWAGGLAVVKLLDRTPPPVSAAPPPQLQPSAPAPVVEPATPNPSPPPSEPSSEPLPEVPAPVPAPAAAAVPPIERIAAFLGAYDGGACFFAKVLDVTDHSAGIEGFAAGVEGFDAFAKAFAARIGFEPDVIGNRLWTPQCPATVFLRQAQETGGAAPTLFLKSTRLRSGQVLSGAVNGAEDQVVMLLRVHEDGTVDNVSRALKETAGSQEFDLPLSQDGKGGPYPQLVVAITSSQALAPPANGQPAAKVFSALMKSAAERKQKLGVIAKLVLLGG